MAATVLLGTPNHGNGVSVSPHASTVAGDYMLLHVSSRGSAGVIASGPLTGDGWTELADSPSTIDSNGDDLSARVTAYYKRHTGSQGAVSVSVSSGFPSLQARIITLQGVLPSTGEATLTSLPGTDGTGTGISFTGDVTTLDDATVVILGMVMGPAASTLSSWANASLSSFNVTDYNVSTDDQHSIVATGVKTTAGAFSATTGTSSNGTINKAFIVLSFADTEPDPPGPGTPGEEIEYTPPEPARALIEIYVPDPEGSKWGEALWGSGAWSTARWQDITYLCVSADISWGVERPDAGILADVEAGRWEIVTYDLREGVESPRDRTLDPSNADSIYYPYITYGLPIRISHRGKVIRTGHCEVIEYSFESGFGLIRATDAIATLAAVTVPEDVSLPDKLHDRAAAVIAATGVPLSVVMTAGGGPDLAPWEPGNFTAWDIIRESAREVHYLPFIQFDTRLVFRAWDAPIDRGGVIGSPELIDIVPSVSADSLYSVVQVVDWAPGPTLTDIERRITPLPRYGERVHQRTLQTINGGDWADRVLEDRGQSGLRYRLGAIFPLDADSVEYLSYVLMNEFLTVDYPEADPDVEVRVRVLGERIRVVDLGERNGPDWRWWFATTTSYLSPLIADDVSPPEVLVDDDTGDYLYPDGVVGLE